ncbi:MAG: ATP-binding cassette domain-containing protein [Candidatus Caldarchaeum sp.]
MVVESALVKLDEIKIGYESVVLTGSINIEFHRGEFWAIVGENGAGKTTLVRTILGLTPPLFGRVTMEKGIVIGFVPQRDGFDPIYPLSVFEVVEMGRRSRLGLARRLSKHDRKIIMHELERLGVLHLANHPFRSLSGGERQRVIIARALVGEPDLLVLDEPSSSLDIEGERTVLEVVSGEVKSRGMCAVMVTHAISHVYKFATHAVLISRDSRTLMKGRTEEVFCRKHNAADANIIKE